MFRVLNPNKKRIIVLLISVWITITGWSNIYAGEFTHPRMDDVLLEMSDVLQKSDMTFTNDWGADRGLKIRDGKVNVEIVSASETPMPLSEIDSFGGYVDATWRNQHSAWLPIEKLHEIANATSYEYYIRRPAEPYPDEVNSGAPAVTGVFEYHNAGFDGTGVVIGIIDMGYKDLTVAENNGDIPPDLLQRTDIDYTGQGMESGTVAHGTSCVEIVYDMAPGATYRIYKISNSTHMGLAVDDGIANDVNIWSHSIGWYNRGWHDDTGEPCFNANLASQNNQIFCVAAGNRARAHYQGIFSDNDNDSLHEWSGTDEYNRTPETGYYISNGGSFWVALQWNTDGTGIDNYDLYLYDDPNGNNMIASGENDGENYEFISYTNNSGASDEYWIAVKLVSGEGVEFEVFSNLTRGFEYFISSSSISSPSNATGENVISVGAVDLDLFTEPSPNIIYYSSWGPSNDGKLSPSITAPTNCPTFASGGDFGGTSCSAPNVAGAAAVIWQFQPSPTAAIVRDYLLSNALLNSDWGYIGADNVFGYGGLNVDLPGWGLFAGRVTEPRNGDGLQAEIAVINRVPQLTTTCDSNGYYSIGVPADSLWQVTASLNDEFLPDTTYIIVAEHDTTIQGFILNYARDLSIYMIPQYAPPFSVPAGWSFYYTGILTNNTAVTQYVDVQISLWLPNGEPYGPLNEFYNICLNPWEEIVYENVEQEIPTYALDGDYWYVARCGNYPYNLVDSDSFQFIVFHWMSAKGDADNWNLSGWNDETSTNLPQTTELLSNFPNPFNATTNISFDLAQTGQVSLNIYNLMGQKVETLIDGVISPGRHNITWDASSYSSGIYFYKLTTNNKTMTKRMMLLK